MERVGVRNSPMEMCLRWHIPRNCIIQQKNEMMFVSPHFLIFIHYIFQLNWNLSVHILGERHHCCVGAVFTEIRCNKGEKWIGRRE